MRRRSTALATRGLHLANRAILLRASLAVSSGCMTVYLARLRGSMRALIPCAMRYKVGGIMALLLYRDQVELARRFFVKERALLLVAAAPVLPTARKLDELARPDALLAGIVLVQIRPFEHDDPKIVCVSMHARVEPRHELRKRAVRPLVMV